MKRVEKSKRDDENRERERRDDVETFIARLEFIP